MDVLTEAATGQGRPRQSGSDPLAEFERLVHGGQHAAALDYLFGLLDAINATGGRLPLQQPLPEIFPGRATAEAATRLCAALGELSAAPGFVLSEHAFRRLIGRHRWLHALFASSSFGNADHLLNRLGLSGSREALERADGADLLAFCLLYGQESRLPVDFTALFKRSPVMSCALAIALLSNRIVVTPAAHQKRERLLKWTAEALDKLPGLDGLPIEVLIDLFMHCSYADDPQKHDIKKPLNRLIRRHLAALGFADPPLAPPAGPRQTVFVVLEWFHQTHSIMRTHSRSLLALKQHYQLVGLGPARMVDEAGKAVFDAYHEFAPLDFSLGFLDAVMDLVRQHRPAAVYFPSVGMAVYSLFLINLRLAPLQCMALGHPATTHSDKIDCALVEEDYIGDPALFSERLVALPRNAIPYLEPSIPHPVAAPRKAGGPVKVAIPASLMKLNPRFLITCRSVQERAQREVEFHIMAGGSFGVAHDYFEKSILALLPGARVHPTLPYAQYMQNIAGCDLFANPFPFGNTNGIVDTVFCGLPGVCLTGGEVHAHIDEGMFRRMSFPEWTIARTVEDYISALVRLIDDEALRQDLNSRILRERWNRVLYEGRPEAFAETVKHLVDGSVNSPLASGL